MGEYYFCRFNSAINTDTTILFLVKSIPRMKPLKQYPIYINSCDNQNNQVLINPKSHSSGGKLAIYKKYIYI